MRFVDNWKEVSDKEITHFRELASRLRGRVLPKDCDGDYPVDLLIVDRRKFERLHYQCVPYHEDGNDEVVEEALLINLQIAIDAFSRFRQVQRIRRR